LGEGRGGDERADLFEELALLAREAGVGDGAGDAGVVGGALGGEPVGNRLSGIVNCCDCIRLCVVD